MKLKLYSTLTCITLTVAFACMTPAMVEAKPKPHKKAHGPMQAGVGGGEKDFLEAWDMRLEEFDRNNNGILDDKEIEKFREARWEKLLEKFDADGNGRLSAEEKENISNSKSKLRFAHDPWLRILMIYDENGNGKLENREEDKLREQRQEFRQANRNF